MAQTRKNRILPLILVLVCAAVMLRSAFTGLEIDEEYALSLGATPISSTPAQHMPRISYGGG